MIGTIWTKKDWLTFLVIEKNDPNDFFTGPNDRYTVIKATGYVEYGVYVPTDMEQHNWIRLL